MRPPGNGLATGQQNRPLDDGSRHLEVCGSQDPAEGRPRNPHADGSLLLVEPLQVGQPECLELVETEDHHGKIPGGPPQGPEPLCPETAGNAAWYGWSSHDSF